MSVFDLVARAAGFERVVERKATGAVETPWLWPLWRRGQPDWTVPTLQGFAEAGYGDNALVYACLARRAQSAAMAPLLAYTGERSAPERVPDDHPLARLLRKPNGFMSWYEFTECLITYLDLDGNAFIYKPQAARGAWPVGFFPLRSDRVRVVPGSTRTDPLLGYVYDPEDTGAWSKEPYLPDEIIHVKFPNPRDPFEGLGRGTSPLSAAAKSVDVDNAATSFLKEFLDHGVAPFGLLKSKQKLLDTEVKRIRERLRAQYGGVENWGDVMILDADAEYQRLGLTMQEMTFDDLDARNEVRICMALMVPPIIVGAKVGLDRSTFANYGEARQSFWEDTLIPGLYQRFEDGFNGRLERDGVWMAYDFSRVPALQEVRIRRMEVAVRAFLGGLARRGEARAFANGHSVDLPPVAPEEDGFRAAEEQQIGTPAITQTPARVSGAAAEGQRSRGAEEQGEDGKTNSPFGMKGIPDEDGNLEQRLAIEDMGLKAIGAALRRQLRAAAPSDATAESLARAEERLAAASPGLRDAVYAMMRDACDLGLARAQGQVDALLGIGGAPGKTAAGQQMGIGQKVEVGIDWSLVNAEVLRWLESYAFTLVRGIDANSARLLREAIDRWTRNGLPLPALIKELGPVFGPVRAQMIAATEVTRAYAEANLRAWQASGVIDRMTWRTANDEKVCSVCSALGGIEWGDDGSVPTSIADQVTNGLVTPIGQPFVHPGGGGAQGRFAGQEFRAPPAHPRCILPGNEVVVPGGVSAAAKSFYVGRCVEIRLANGRKLSVTTNHPILTPKGWIAAQFINEGDDVICASDAEWIAARIQPDDDHRPTKIEEVFDSIMKAQSMSPACVKPAAEDFYGDGRSIHGDINIVHVDGFLRGNVEATLPELISEHSFDVCRMRQRLLSALGVGNFPGMRNCAAPGGFMSAVEHSGPFFSSGAFPTNQHRVGHITGLDASLQQAMAERRAINSGLRSKSLFGLASTITGEQVVEIGDVNTSGEMGAMLGVTGPVHSIADKSGAQQLSIDTTLAREFCETFAIQVTTSKVREIRDFDFAGHVYDLQADMYELYICNGAIVKNCRCWLAPVV